MLVWGKIYLLVSQRLECGLTPTLKTVCGIFLLLLIIPIAFIQCAPIETSSVTDIISEGDRMPSFAARVSISDSSDWRYGLGDVFDTSELQGKVGIVVFFHTSCDDCKRELPVVQSVYDNIKDNVSISLVCISRAESEPDIRDYFSSNGLSLPYSAQPDRKIYGMFASEGIPRIYVADTEGIVKKVYTDSNAPDYAELMKVIESSRTI